jgi:hypothetical protein
MLSELLTRYVETNGVEATAQALDLTPESIDRALAGTARLRQDHCERLLELTGSKVVTRNGQTANGEMPDAEAFVDLETSTFAMAYRKPQYPLTMLIAYDKGFPGAVVASLLYYAKHLDIGFDLQGETLLIRARNILAQRFLASAAQWAFWVDSDVFMPFGNPAAFLNYTKAKKLSPTFAGQNVITRLLSHKLPLVGGVYASRSPGGPLVIQSELHPRNPNDLRVNESIREGKTAGVQAQDYLANGLMMVHRSVFETIMQKQPLEGLKPGESYPFFTPTLNEGEDVAFCARARRAGFQPMLDTEIRAGHIGIYIALPEHSAPPVRLGGQTTRRPPEE